MELGQVDVVGRELGRDLNLALRRLVGKLCLRAGPDLHLAKAPPSVAPGGLEEHVVPDGGRFGGSQRGRAPGRHQDELRARDLQHLRRRARRGRHRLPRLFEAFRRENGRLPLPGMGLPYPLTFEDMFQLSKSKDNDAHFLLAELIKMYPNAFSNTESAIQFLCPVLSSILINAYSNGEILNGLKISCTKMNLQKTWAMAYPMHRPDIGGPALAKNLSIVIAASH